MNLCSDDHDEICFEGRACPLCRVRSDLQDDLDSAQARIVDLQERVKALEAGEI